MTIGTWRAAAFWLLFVAGAGSALRLDGFRREREGSGARWRLARFCRFGLEQSDHGAALPLGGVPCACCVISPTYPLLPSLLLVLLPNGLMPPSTEPNPFPR